MTYFDELRDGADTHFSEWLRGLAAGDPSARAAAWGLRLSLDGLTPAAAFERVAEAVDRYASPHRVLYGAATCGGPHDDDDAIESALTMMALVVSERGMPEAEREARLRGRIVERIRVGSYDEGDVRWLEERAAAMTDAEILQMDPWDGERVTEISRRVVTATTPQRCHWTRRAIPAGERHLVLVETLRGREHETRHSMLSAYLHVVAADGGASEFLAEYEDHHALAG